MKVEFFIPGRVESGNKRQRTHWKKRHREDKRDQGFWSILMRSNCPRDVLVSEPHPRREIDLLVFRKRLLDYDNLVTGLKPFIDVLRCRWNRKLKILDWSGIIYDDSPKYVRWSIDQRLLMEKGNVEGVRVILDIPKEAE